MEPTPQPSDYFLEIESHFATRRGTPFILSSRDWLLMKGWFEEGVPLAIVIEAIDSCFDKSAARPSKRVISSLSYCRHAVKEIWSERRDLYVGSDESTPETSPRAQLEALGAALRAAATAASEAVRLVVEQGAAAVEGASGLHSIPKIEERLMEIEHQLLEKLAATMTEAEIAEVRREVAASFRGGRGKVDDATRLRTEEANLRRLMRSRHGLPRLSLFS
jgi:hypothetical protein